MLNKLSQHKVDFPTKAKSPVAISTCFRSDGCCSGRSLYANDQNMFQANLFIEPQSHFLRNETAQKL